MSQPNTTSGIPIPEGFTLVSQPESTPPPGGIPIPEGLTLMEELTPAQLKNIKAQGGKLTEAQERTLWDIEDAKPATEKVGEAVSAAIPAVRQALTDFGGGAVDLVYKGILRPVGASVIGMDDAEAAEIFDTAGKTLRSGAIGVARDVEETANAATRFAFFGSDLTDRAQGLDKEERFKRYMNREAMRQLEQAAREQNPDRANALLAENPLLQRLTATIATIQNGTPEEAEEAAKAYSEYLYETGLTKDEINEKVATVGEFMSPVAIPGAGKGTTFILKRIGKAMTKTGDFALRNVALPIATGVEFGARKTVAGGEFLQNTAKGLGQYIVNDPDTFLKTGTNTVVMPVMGPAKAIANTSGVIKDILTQAADAGGTRGRRGIVERAGRSLTSSDTTRALFGPDNKGGVFRAKTLDFMLRQGDAILQPGVNAAALNVVMGLPDIETGEQAGFAAGTGFGIGAIGGARVTERASALIDPRLSGAQRLTELLAVDPSQRRANEDADLRRFLATASPELQAQMADLSSIEKRKLAVKSRIASLETEKAKKISKADEEFVQSQIDGFQNQLAGLEKATPETQKEADRQVQLAFLDALDQAHSVGLSAGLSKLNIEVLDPANAEQYFRKKYGQTLTDAENTIALLTGIPSLSGADSQKLAEARELMARFNSQVNGAITSRGFALNEDSTDPNSERYVPPHLRMLNQQGATAVINGDLLRHLGREGFNIRHVVQHEVQHALQNFNEVQQALRPVREYLFDQKIRNTDGTTETISEGIFSDNDIDRIAAAYASRMSPADNGASFIAGFGGDLGKLRAYMKDEILAEVAATGGEYANGTRASLDEVGQNLMDWLEVKTKNGALKSMKESLRKVGVVFDNNGEYSSVLETGFTPEVLATIRQYQRGIRDLNNTLTYTRNVEKDTPDIPLTKVLASKALQNKYRHADFFEQEPVIRATAPDGTVTEIPVPKNVNLNPFVDVYRIANGQLVDADGKPISLAPEIQFGSLPDGTTLQADTRIARKVDGTPIVLTNREMKARGIERTKMIRNAIDSAPDDGSPTRLVDTGNGNYRGTMSPSQIEAFMQLPNSLVPPRMKRMVAEVNEILNRRDGTRLLFEYQPALLNGKYKALSPRIRDEVPIGFQVTKDGNFAITTISVSRMYDKAEAWAAKRPTRLQAWNGDMGLFWDDVMKALGNHARGEKMEVGLDPDPYIALRKKNRINDLFNVYNAETKDANPERTTLPREKGKDSLDIVIRSRRIDRINEMSESSAQKMPFNYGLMTQNYLPADPITPEEFVVRTQSSVTPTRMRELIAAGKIDELQNILRASDDLLLQESLYVAPGGKIGVTSLFDPNIEPSLEDAELLVDLDAETNALRESLTSPEARAKYLSDQLETMYARGGTDPEIEAFESELEGIYQQLESQAEEQEAATEDVVEAPETTEVDTMNSPNDALLAAVDAYNSGRADNETQTLAQYIRSAVASEGLLRIPDGITDEQIEAAANDVVQYRESLKDRIRSGVAFSNAIVAPAGLQFLPAFHGSPYDFDKFRMDKIGSGEGAQAYGYGLYFAGARGVANSYKSMMDNIPVLTIRDRNGNIIAKNESVSSGMFEASKWIEAGKRMAGQFSHNTGYYAKKAFEDSFKRFPEYLQNPDNQNVLKALDEIINNDYKIGYEQHSGNLYTVDLDVDDADLLDWDGSNLKDTDDLASGKINDSISKKILGWEDIQSIEDFEQKLKEAEREFAYGGETGFYNLAMDDARQNNLSDVVDYWAGAYVNGAATGEKIYNYLSATTSPKQASEYLNSIGIPGIRYLDGMSRGAGEGTYNYVIFDENLIKVLEKNDQPVGPITQFMPSESDTEYLRLAQDPEKNREQLQRMVNEAAKKAGYEPKKLFHGTLEGGFTKFDPEKIGSATDKGWFGKAFWFSDDYGYSAANYAGEYRGKLPKGAEVKEVYLSLKNPKIIPWVAEDEKARRTSDPESATQNAINQGHDGFLVQKNPRYGEWYEYGVFDPSQIKSADPVTYDDEGNVIPLSQRFQTTSPDIRFMPAEEPQGMEDVEMPQTYRRISGMIPPLQGVEPPVRASEKQDKPLFGININDKTQDFTDQILRGEKTIETRDTNSLKPYIGKRVGIVKTGKGKATLVGYANIGEPIVYNNESEFRLDQDKHLVEQGSSFDIKPNSSKYGYPLSDIEPIKPVEIESKGIVSRSLPQTQFMPIEQQVEGDIPVAKTEADAEEEVADTELRSTGIDVPESVDEQSVISNAIKVANSQSWKKGRDFKMDLQRRVMEAADKAGVTISDRTAESIEYLARVGLKDALIALEQNPNAIGWYDEKTKQALGVMSLLFPEIATDENARFAFTWALAVTSNGLKVDKNFELAERVYRKYRKTGKMPNNIQAGQAQKAINKSLDLFNQLTKEWGIDNTRKFMQADFTVGEISRLGVVSKADKKEVKPGGEFSDTIVRGSAILGPKIGNGFFSNLYGLFDALTMDRWLVRTWGRWTGTLVELNPKLTQISKTRLEETLAALTPEDKARMDEMIGQDISQMSTEDLSLAIQKASMKPELREVMNTTPTGEEFRKAGNSLAKYLDGQKEAPANPAERNFIREIFGLMLDELKSDPKYAGLTMADLQAVLWYAEKRLYETAKVKADQDNLDSSDAEGYEDDEAPDYANAAIGVAREKGVSQKRIDEVLEKIKNDRTTTTRLADEGRGGIETEQQKSAGGFTGKEKQKFRQYVAVTTARRNRTGNEKALWTYSRKSGGDGRELRVLKPKSKKNLGVKYISEWKAGRKLATMYRNNGLSPVKFLELDSTDIPSAQKFADALTQSKEESKYGAAVYVYDTKDYQNMKLFMSESGKAGFAVKPDGDIVSVFSMEKGSGRSVIEAAIAAGGKKLDAFDTILPEFYGAHGFVEAARIPWNEEQAQYMEDWDKETFKEFNNGEPDVVMMVLDPKFKGEYEPRTDIYATDYDQAVEMQDSLLKKMNKGVRK